MVVKEIDKSLQFDIFTIIEEALLIRSVEEKLLELYGQGKLNGTVHTCIGQELISVCVSSHLQAKDYVVSNHRGHGHYLARTKDIEGLIAEVMGKISGASGGIGGSQHLCNDNYLSNGIQAGMAPIAAGISLSNQMQGYLDRIVVAYIGDGTLGEGILYETFNLCAIWNIPILFVLENNGIAQSTSFRQTFAGSVQQRVEGFGLKYKESNNWSLPALLSTCEAAVTYVRTEQKPMLLEIQTYRLKSHSKGDDNRDVQEIDAYVKKDVLNQFLDKYPSQATGMLKKINEKITAAVQQAAKSETLSYYPSEPLFSSKPVEYTMAVSSTKRVNELIYEALQQVMIAHAQVVMIGEDIEWTTHWTSKGYGGAFKVSKDLSSNFEGRVRNTPISEAAITGIGTGLALGGMKPIVEIMFGDFMTLTIDQLFQHACKFHKMFNGKVNVPLIVRTPMGGKRGYGPTHSQSIEKFFLGIPDLRVIALNHRISPRLIYERIFDTITSPTLVIENKVLYTRKVNEYPIEGFLIQQTNEIYPSVRITPNGKRPQITLVGYGGVLEELEAALSLAFDEEEVLCEIIAPTELCPINMWPIIDSVRQTQRLIIVEEGCSFGALSAEIVAVLTENNLSLKYFRRLSNDTIIPCSFEAEQNLLPNRNSIFEAIKQAINE